MDRGRSTRSLIYFLFFLSGISGLVYQIVWTRLLVLVFGNTLLATSTVLSAFMAGLAAGSFLLGRWVDRRSPPLLKLYAVLELGIGLFALAFPLLLDAATPLYSGLYRSLQGNLVGLDLARFAVCFALIFVPTFLMGGTLPVLLKRFAGGRRTIGAETGLLYGLNTAGAVAGTLACGYLLLRLLGMNRTTWIAVAINLGVALLAWLVGRAEPRDRGEASAPAPATSTDPGAAVQLSRATAAMVLVGIGISGFCALAYEVFWTRMLNLFVNHNVYSFTAILGTFLTGIALGSLLYSRFFETYRRPVALFVALQTAIGILSFATPFIFNLLHGSLFSRRSEVLTLAKTAAIMLGPTILMGIAVPLAVQICQRGVRREGTSVGTVYAVNTVGAIFGAVAAGFLLLPTAGLQRGVLIVATLNLLAAVLALCSVAGRQARRWTVAAYLGLVAVAFAATPDTAFRTLYQRALPDAEILHYKEGKVANVVVYDLVKGGWKDLFLNGVEEASSRIWHVQLFKMLGILPPMLHPDPDDALMVAFGAGMSAGACVDQVDRLDCVDLNPDIHEVAEIFRHENRRVLDHPNFHLIENDGRNALLLTDRRYSLIISDATNPKSFDSWTLYTREFYELVRDRLLADGIFCQWVVIPLTGNSIKVVLNTFRSVFPHASLWCIYGSTQCLMLATPERLEIDHQELSRRLEPVLESSGLAEFGVGTVDKFLSFFLLGEDGLGRALAGFRTVNTDDLPIAQFRVSSRDAGIAATADLLRNQESIRTYLTNLPNDGIDHETRLAAYGEIARRLTWGFLLSNDDESHAARLVATSAGLGEDANVASSLFFDSKKKEYFLDRLRLEPADANAHNSLGHIFRMEGHYDQAIERFREALRLRPDFATAQANLGRALRDAGDYDRASEAFLGLREINPTARVLGQVERQLQILRLLQKLHYEPTNPGLRNDLLRAYLEDGEVFKAAAAARVSVTLDPADLDNWRFLARLYEQLDFPDRAAGAWQRVQALTPADPTPRLRTEQLLRLRSDPSARLQWLNRSKQPPTAAPAAGDGSEPERDHPEACDRARKMWNTVPPEGSIGRSELEAAAAEFLEATYQAPDHLHAYQSAVRLFEILGEYEQATVTAKRALVESPAYRPAMVALRRLDLLRAIDSDLTDPELRAQRRIDLGTLQLQTGEPEEAVESFRRAVEENADAVRGWLGLATAYEQIGRYEPAIEALENALTAERAGELAAKLRQQLEALRDRVRRSPDRSWDALWEAAELAF